MNAARSGSRTANVIGLGLIGGSIAAGLRQRGWRVHGHDSDAGRAATAAARDVVDEIGISGDATLTFVAVPVLAAADCVLDALRHTAGAVTDVGSVKGELCAQVDHPRFVGGHPMAGSELEGLDGADPAMFEGAVWVLTPTTTSDQSALSTVAGAVRELGAEMVAMAPDRHDETVAVVSHVPHLAAASLMGVAADGASEHAALLRLAAGGFRDMTRIASGHPDIWLDICRQNRVEITGALDRLIARLSDVRDIVDRADSEALLDRLQAARSARSNLPSRIATPEQLAEFRIPIPDRPGAAAEIFTLAAAGNVNIASFEVVHLAEANAGVAVVLVDADTAERYRQSLVGAGFRPGVTALS